MVVVGGSGDDCMAMRSTHALGGFWLLLSNSSSSLSYLPFVFGCLGGRDAEYLPTGMLA